MSKRIITWVKPTGSSLHLGNLLGAVLPFQSLAQGNDAAIFIADLHALTSVKNWDTMRDQSFELAVEYFSIFGLDSDITIFRQSDITDITKLMWILANVTPYSLMLRAHSYKDFQQQREVLQANINKSRGAIDAWLELKDMLAKEKPDYSIESQVQKNIQEQSHQNILAQSFLDQQIQNFENNLNMWVFNYPILMAGDIIGYDIDAVPVGKDQIQHLEMTRDIARAFNKTYGHEVFREPEAIITKEVETLPGIDGRKMSKSYDNFIGVFDDDKTLKKRVMSIMTGSEWVDEKKKNPDECNVFNLYKIFATPEQTKDLKKKYESTHIGFGYGHAKTALLEVLTTYLHPYRIARENLLKNPEIVEKRLAEWARIMNARLEAKMKVVNKMVGVN